MPAPRMLLARKTYLVTRYVTQRQWFLRGDADTNRIFLYWLAVAAKRTGVEVHGFVLMATHWHAIVTDRVGNLPEFVHALDLGVAVDMNAKLKRRENFWSTQRTEIVPLDGAELVVEKLAELITSPVAAGLVRSPSDWPGSLTLGLCERHVVGRPEDRSPDDEDAIPEEARVDCTMPPALRDLPPEEARRLLKARVAELTARARERVREAGGGFLGPDRVRTMPHAGPPATHGKSGNGKPWVTRLTAEVQRALNEELRVFLKAYELALALWRARNRRVEFPDGTYLMRVLHRVWCSAPAAVV